LVSVLGGSWVGDLDIFFLVDDDHLSLQQFFLLRLVRRSLFDWKPGGIGTGKEKKKEKKEKKNWKTMHCAL
jgi:hypothetical protein